MKKLILAILALCFIFTATVFAGHSSPPRDGRWQQIVAIGSSNQVFWMDNDTDGTWQEVTLPSDTECKAVWIQVHSGSDTVYDMDTACAGFLFSHETGGDFIYVQKAGFARSIGVVSSNSISLGWVKAEAGAKISVLILY